MRVFALLIWLVLLSVSGARADVGIVTGEEPPFTFYNAEGELDGYVVEFTRALQTRLGNQANIEINPWARVYYRAKNDQNILALSLVRTPEREDDFYWIKAMSRNVHGIYQLEQPEMRFHQLSELKGEALIGVERSDFREQLLLDAGLDNIVSYTHWGQAVEALVKGRVARLFFSPAGIAHFCKTQQLDCGRMYSVYRHQMVSTYMAMPRGGVDPTTAERWRQAAMAYIQSEDYRSMALRWERIYQQDHDMKLHIDLNEGVINLWARASEPAERYQTPTNDASQ